VSVAVSDSPEEQGPAAVAEAGYTLK